MSNDATALITVTSQAYSGDSALAASSEACPSCTTQISAGEMYCPRCGYQRGTWKAAAGSPAAAAPGASLLEGRAAADWILEGAGGLSLRLVQGEQVLGRGEVEHRLDDTFTSRRHARIVVSDAGVSLEDLGSSNGSFIGESRLSPGEVHTLEAGSEIRLGQTAFTLRQAAHDTAAVVTPAAADGTAVLPPTDTAEAVEAEAEDAEDAAATAAAAASGWLLKREAYPDLPLRPGVTTLGRKADKCDQVIEGDSYISGLHCQLEVFEDKVVLTDLGSTNGSYIDEERLEPNVPRELEAGAHFRIGQTEMQLLAAEAEPAD